MSQDDLHDPNVAAALTAALRKLNAAKDIRPPNEPIPEYIIPTAEDIDGFAARLKRADKNTLVFEVSEILGRIPAPYLSEETTNQEHLSLYFQISQLRSGLEAVNQRARESGYRTSMVIAIPAVEVGDELREMKAALAEVARNVEDIQRELEKPLLGGVAFNLGAISIDINSIRSVAIRLSEYISTQRNNVDAGFIWAAADEIERSATALGQRAVRLGRGISQAFAGAVAALGDVAARLGDVGRSIFQKATRSGQQSQLRKRTLSGLAGRRTQRFALAVDLGTANTRIFIPGRGVVLSEPSVIALRKVHGRRELHAVGVEAKGMLGRTPANIDAIRPLKHGAIADYESAGQMLRYFVQEAFGRKLFPPPKPLIALGAGASVLARNTVAEACEFAGLGKPEFVDKPYAVALGAKVSFHEPAGTLILDVGAGETQVAILTLSGIAHSIGVESGGNTMDQQIVNGARRNSDLIIDEVAAERLKMEGALIEMFGNDPSRYRLRGRDLNRGVPRDILVGSDMLFSTVSPTLNSIAQAVRTCISRVTPTLAHTIGEIRLSGGVAQMKGFSEALRDLIGLPVTTAADPMSCTIHGLAQLAERPEMLNILGQN